MGSYSLAAGSISLAVVDHKQTLSHTGQNYWMLISSDREDFFLICVMKRGWLFGWALWVTRLKLVLKKTVQKRHVSEFDLKRLFDLKPHANGHNILGQHFLHCWMIHVASVCTSCYMLLRVVAICCPKFKTGQIFELTTSIISFVPGSPKRSAAMLPVCTALPRLLGPHTR